MSETWHMIVVLFVFGTAFLLMASNADKVKSLATTATDTGGGISKILSSFGQTKAA